MRRSLAPSQRKELGGTGGNSSNRRHSAPGLTNGRGDGDGDEGDVVIQRMPLFGFLSIPKSLSQQFIVNTGCKVTEKGIALRKVKRLGPSNRYEIRHNILYTVYCILCAAPYVWTTTLSLNPLPSLPPPYLPTYLYPNV
jgi:hypothetical protein